MSPPPPGAGISDPGPASQRPATTPPSTAGTRPDDVEQLRRAEDALRLVTVPFPHFAGLARAVRVELDRRVKDVGVFASGRVVVNADFLRGLRDNEVVFLMAHALFHLALRTHERAAGSDPLRFNFAHDFIINDILRGELQFQRIPGGGLDWPGARRLSAEEILLQMEKDPQSVPARDRAWAGQPCPGKIPRGRGPKAPGGPKRQPGPPGGHGEPDEGDGDEGQPGEGERGDVLDEQTEREWFPDDTDADRDAQEAAMKEAAAKALSLAKFMDSMKGQGRGIEGGAAGQLVTALRGMYRTPWEAALQRWLESVAPGPRTFNRASRRGADRTDVVMPGRKREGWILNIILDTSGSMTEAIPKALGAISHFCTAVAVDQLRLLQCDTAITSDVFLMPEDVGKHQVSGYGGSDLTPAMRFLAEDPRVEACVVLTDGDIAYPPEAMPYDVLWVLPPHGMPAFRPPYGAVITMTPS